MCFVGPGTIVALCIFAWWAADHARVGSKNLAPHLQQAALELKQKVLAEVGSVSSNVNTQVNNTSQSVQESARVAVRSVTGNVIRKTDQAALAVTGVVTKTTGTLVTKLGMQPGGVAHQLMPPQR